MEAWVAAVVVKAIPATLASHRACGEGSGATGETVPGCWMMSSGNAFRLTDPQIAIEREREREREMASGISCSGEV